MWTQSQLAAAIENKNKTRLHEARMKSDAAFRAQIEREAQEYEEFCAVFGEPER